LVWLLLVLVVGNRRVVLSQEKDISDSNSNCLGSYRNKDEAHKYGPEKSTVYDTQLSGFHLKPDMSDCLFFLFLLLLAFLIYPYSLSVIPKLWSVMLCWWATRKLKTGDGHKNYKLHSLIFAFDVHP